MDKSSESGDGRNYGMDDYRGIMTNRGVLKEVGAVGNTIGGVFDKLGLTIKELRGKKILDVGTGGGRTVDEARRFGLNVVGVDIAPIINTTGPGSDFDKSNVNSITDSLKEVAKTHKDSIVGSDATVALPFRDMSFDIVFSHLGLPGYARNPREFAISILEMIRVAKQRVVISGREFHESDAEGVHQVGPEKNDFRIAYKKFLDLLENDYGLRVNIIPASNLMSIPAFHIDVTRKRGEKLKTDRSKIIQEAERLRR